MAQQKEETSVTVTMRVSKPHYDKMEVWAKEMKRPPANAARYFLETALEEKFPELKENKGN